MSKKKICFIAQFPPPIHGLSKAVETVYNSHLSEKYIFEKVDITKNKKIFKNLWNISKSKSDLFYFTISQTRAGNIRDLIILKLLNLQKKKCLLHLHGGYYRKLLENDLPKWQRKLNYLLVSEVEAAIVLSKSLKSIFEGILPDDKIYTISNCVDDQFLMNDNMFEEKFLAINTEKQIFNILYLSNFIKSKGYVQVLELAKLEKARVLSGDKRILHFNFAGKFYEESEQKFFDNYIIENGLEDFVTYHGIVDGKSKNELLKLCDCFVLLTNYPNEGQPISILEAMGNGMIIVTTNHAGIPDIVLNNVNGIVIENKNININQCYNNLISIISDTTTMKRMIRKNRETVKKNFTQHIYIDNFEKCFYEQIEK